MLFGALWNDDPEVGDCFRFITVPPSDFMSRLHTREPWMLDLEQAATWLDMSQKPPAIKSLIQTYTGPLAEFECPDPKQDRPPQPGKKRDLFN